MAKSKVDASLLDEINQMNNYMETIPGGEGELKDEPTNTSTDASNSDEIDGDDPEGDNKEGEEESREGSEETKEEETKDEEEDAKKGVEEETEDDEVDPLEAIRKELDSVLASKVVETSKRSTTTTPTEVNFLEEFELEEDGALDPKKLNKLLNKVYHKGREEVTQIQDTLTQDMQHKATMARFNEEFYGKNKDLTNYRNFVGKVGQDILGGLSAEDKEKLSLEEYFDLVANSARKRLMIKIEKEVGESKQDKPSFPKTKGVKKSSKKSDAKLSEMEKEMETMIKYAEQF
jgi:hypothetical protein